MTDNPNEFQRDAESRFGGTRFNLKPVTVDPQYPRNGDSWFRVDQQLIKVRIDNVTYGLALIDDGTGKLLASQTPDIAINDVFVVNSEAEMLALAANVGDTAIRQDTGEVWLLIAEPASNILNWQNLANVSASVASVNGETGVVTLTTSDIPEGINLYYTAARFTAAFSTKSTTDLAEGTNLYYTSSRFNTAFAGKTTSDLVEGSQLYYTNARFDARLATKTTTNLAEGTNLYYTTARANTDFDARLATKTTTQLAEGSNLYYTQTRFNSAFALKTTTDLNEGANLYYTDARVRVNRLDQMAAPTANLSINGHKLVSVQDPTAAQDAATKNYVDSKSFGLIWQAPIELINIVGSSTTPVAPVDFDAYIIDLGGNTGVWSGFNQGDVVQSQGGVYQFIKALQVGDRFVVAGKTINPPSGVFASKKNYIAVCTNATPGSLAFTFTAPVDNDALYVENVNAAYHNATYTYSATLIEWIQLSTSATLVYGEGLTLSGNVLRTKPDEITIGHNGSGELEVIASTSYIPEGTNLYYTATRFNSAFSAKSTSDLSEGTNLYYTDTRFDTRFGTKTTTNLAEGANLYYTTTRANADFDTRLTTKSTTNLTEGTNLYYTTGRANTDFDARLLTKTTDNLNEGASNLYYTTARFDTRLATKTTSDLAEGTNLYYTNSRADARIALQKGAANGIATLDADGKIPTAQLPALAITDTFVVASQVAMLALSAETGDVAVRTDLNKSYILAGSDPTVLANWQELLTPTDAVLSVNGQTGTVVLTTTNIAEGTNLYYTDTRFDTRFGTKTTTNLAEGTNLYYTDARVRANRLDQMAVPTANVSMNSNKLTNVTDPTSAQDAATKLYVDSKQNAMSSPAQITANQNNYNPGSGKVFRLTSDATGRQITGLSVGQVDGTIIMLINVNTSNFNISIRNQDAGSTAANRFQLSTNANINLGQYDTMTFIYDATSQVWRDI